MVSCSQSGDALPCASPTTIAIARTIGIIVASLPPLLLCSSRQCCTSTDMIIPMNQVEFPSTCDAISEFDCSEEIEQEYRFSLLQPLIKALVLSEKVCIRLGHSGMLQVRSAEIQQNLWRRDHGSWIQISGDQSHSVARALWLSSTHSLTQSLVSFSSLFLSLHLPLPP